MTATTVKSTTTPTVATTSVPSWASLKTQYRGAEQRGVKARNAAYDVITRAFALTSETESGKDGVKARSDRSRAAEVLDALGVESGNVFALSVVRVAQIVKTYGAIARAGVDPYSDNGHALFAQFDAIRKADAGSLDRAADRYRGASDNDKEATLVKAVAEAKEAAKSRKSDKGETTKAVKVDSLQGVLAFAEAALPVVRKESATASEADKAAARKALEALLAHLQ